MAQAIAYFLATAGSGGTNLQRFVYAVTFYGDDVSAEIATMRQIEIEVSVSNDFEPAELNDALLTALQVKASALGLTISSTDVRTFRMERMDTSLAENMIALGPIEWHRFGIDITSSGGFVSQWDDKSGNGHHIKQATATNQPALQADGSILFDGIDNFMATDTYVLNQPTTVCMLAKQVTWTSGETVSDGVLVNGGRIQQISLSPHFRIFAGSGASENVDWTLDTYAVLQAVFNGASSLSQINNLTPVTDSVGSGVMSGLTLGAVGLGVASWSNIQVKEVIVFPSALDAAGRAVVSAYLAQIGGLSI